MTPFGVIHTLDTITLSKSAKMFRNWPKLKNTNNRRKSSGFRRAPVAKRICTWHFYGFSANFTTFYENKMAAEKILIFYGFRTPRKHIFVHSPWSRLHFALTKTTAICMYFSVASSKVPTLSKIWRGRCTLSASHSQWEEHLNRLEYGQLRLLTGEKGRKFETSSTKDKRDIRERIGQHLRG